MYKNSVFLYFEVHLRLPLRVYCTYGRSELLKWRINSVRSRLQNVFWNPPFGYNLEI